MEGTRLVRWYPKRYPIGDFWELDDLAEILSKLHAFCEAKGFKNVRIMEIEDNRGYDTENQRLDIQIVTEDGGYQKIIKLLMLKGEILDGMEFHRRFEEFYPHEPLR